ncbi:MAG: hypothetical protein AAB214_06035, partial [Fibrobacterota bacterium]
GSKPVSFSGEALMRFIGTSYDEYPGWMSKDAVETKNSLASVRMAMVAAPQRNLRLWSKIAFNHTFMGNNSPMDATFGGNYRQTPQTGYYDPHSNNLFEDMAAGLMAKTGDVTTHARIGGVLWTEASPLTLWKGQNRMFGWDYVPYELEQSSAQYWEYATIKGEKTGRAAWNKKPFQGINLESIEMPWNLYYTLTYGSFEGFQKFQPYYVNTSNTNGLQYTEALGKRVFATKGLGIGDGFRKATTFRVAKSELPGAITVGANFLNFKTDNDYAKQWVWGAHSGGLSGPDAYGVQAVYRDIGTKILKSKAGVDSATVPDTLLKYKSNFFISHTVGSMDARRTLPGGLQFHVDVALSQTDTSYFKPGGNANASNYKRYVSGFDSAAIASADSFTVVGHRTSAITPAVYGTVNYPTKYAQFDLSGIWAPKDFYSGTSFVMPLDAFFPFESNLLGAGKFAGTDGGTPYASNMTGANLVTKIPVSGGHLRISTGFHKQMDKGRDLIYIPWRLNGAAFKYSQNSSTTQYDGAGLEDAYMRGNPPFDGATSTPTLTAGQLRQVRRIGDDFYEFPNPDKAKWEGGSPRRNGYGAAGGESGGIRGDFMATFENFGLYRMRRLTLAEKNSGDSALIKSRLAEYKSDSMDIVNMGIYGKLPQSAKSTQNLSLDVSYDVARLWGGKKALFLGFYGSLNSVTKNGTPIPALGDDENTAVRGSLLRFEPVAQLAQGFYLIGLVGMETWKSPYGVALVDTVTGYQPMDAGFALPKNWVSAPIDYTDMMFGIGFDWDMASRVGLHMRLQRFSHEDKGISEFAPKAAGRNDYKAWLLHAETKMWF